MKTHQPTPEEEAFYKMMDLLESVAQHILAKKKKESPFYDSADLKHHLHVCDKTLQRWRRQGKIPYRQLGNKYFYPKAFFDFKPLK